MRSMFRFFSAFVAVLLLVLLPCLTDMILSLSTGTTTQPQKNPRQEAMIQQAAALLYKAGVTDICSPSLGNLIHFPRCNHSTILRLENQRSLTQDTDTGDAHNTESHSRLEFIVDAIGTAVCVVAAALASGLTIGLLSLDPIVLLMKSRAATDEAERKQAASLLPLIQQERRHLLLVTLLLLNTAASEALPMFLHGIFPEFFAVLLAIVLVLVFGEIIPSALFTSSNRIQMAAACSTIVRCLMMILYPVAYPISKCLDYLVHNDDENGGSSVYNRSELAALVRIQYEQRLASKQRRHQVLRDETTLSEISESGRPMVGTSDLSNDGGISSIRDLRKYMLRRNSSGIHQDEVTMMQGALQMKTKCAIDFICSNRKVFSISNNTILDEANICKIFSSGYSRIPVYDGDQKSRIVGILMTRQLILVNDTDNCPVSRLPLYVPHSIAPDTNLVDVINLFQTGGGGRNGRVGHMALVFARPDIAESALSSDEPVPDEAGWMGLLTMEDCIEELLQEPIMDEMDAAGRWRASQDIDQEGGNEGDYQRMV